MRAGLFALLFLWTTAALPCSSRGAEYDRAEDQVDRADQRALVPTLAIQADSILIATAERVDKSSRNHTVHFRVKQVLKGTAITGQLLAYELPPLQVIGCRVADMFNNTWALERVDYIVYSQGAQLLRTGSLDRRWPEISVREEIRRIQKALKKRDV